MPIKLPLILASRSPRRVELLQNLGVIDFECIPADIDETPRKGEQPRELSKRLSREKAEAVAALYPGRVILSGDTVVALGRRILGNPYTPEEVVTFLSLLSGRSHRIYTTVTVIGERVWTRISESRVVFKRLSQDEIKAYADSGEGFGKAGGWALQGFGGSFVMKMTGSPSGVRGLPLYETAGLLKAAGILVRPLPETV